MTSLIEYRKKINKNLHRYEHLQQTIEDEHELLTKAEKHLSAAEEALEIAQQLAQSVQQHAHGKISYVVSKCLKGVFPIDPYKFKIIFERKRSQTEARMVFLRKRYGIWREVKPKDASGGGCIDIASLALRLACLILARPKARRILIADEPFKNVSPEYRPLVPKLIEILEKEMGIQFVFATNFPEYQVGKVIRIKGVKDATA